MAYPSSSSFPPQEQPQLQPSLQSIYQSDQYPNQGFASQAQAFPRQYTEGVPQHVNWTQQQSAFPQESSQQFQLSSDQQSSLNQANSFSQPNQFLQQNPTHQGQTARQQFSQQGQQLQPQYGQQQNPQIQYLQQSQQQTQFPSLSQNQSTQSASPVHQNTYAQQSTQRNSPAQPNLYSQQNQTAQPNLHSQHSQQPSLTQPNQFPGSSALNDPNGFSRQAQHGQQPFSQVQQSHFNPLTLTTQQPRGPPFPQLPNQPVQRSQSLPYPSQPQTSHVPQQPGQQPQSRHSSGDVAGTYQLFFTGRDDPRSCMLIGEDTKPVYLSFDTQESNLNQLMRTNVYKNTRDLCAKLDWGTGGFLGTAAIGNRQFPMAHLVLPGTAENARRFASVDGKQFEWRRTREDAAAYDLYMAPNVRIALFRKYNQLTAIGPSHGLIQYTFSNDVLLIEALLALLLNRWIDTNGIQFSG